MSAQDISAIPTANAITVNTDFREPYRKVIKLLPRIVKLANNQNPNITLAQKQQRMADIRAVVISYLDQMNAALGSVQDTGANANPVFTDFPDT